MTSHITAPGPTAAQLSGYGPNGEWILSVVCKRTYRFERDRLVCALDDDIALHTDLIMDPDAPEVVMHDTDLVPFKPRTDVIVLGQAHTHAGPARELLTEVRVNARAQQVRVLGERRATFTSTGRVLFSEPEPFEALPLRYDRAYGGLDHVAATRLGDPARSFLDFMPDGAKGPGTSDFCYPRNFAGRGYLVEATRDAVEALTLPNLEDPQAPLTPEGLAAGSTRAWPRMPLPACFGAVDPGWFPRLAHLGVVPLHDCPAADFTEVRRGLEPPSIVEESLYSGKPKFDPRFTCCASRGLQLPHLAGDERFSLMHVHPRYARWEFSLPGERPVIHVDGRGKLLRTTPVLQNVTVEPELDRVTVVWRGCAPAIRPYMPQELESMPLQVSW